MDNKYHEKLIVSSSPHMVTKTDTSKIMGTVLIALLPAFAVGIYQFGFRVVTLTAVFVASCVLFEYLYNKITKKPQTVATSVQFLPVCCWHSTARPACLMKLPS